MQGFDALLAAVPQLRDQGALRGALQALRKELDGQMREHYADNMPIQELVAFRSRQMDRLLEVLWQSRDMDPALSLVAVGGYGRGELHPHSDIDLMVLGAGGRAGGGEQKIRSFLTLLWDMGLDVGHSVRTVQECQEESADDVTVATNLMESRLLFGDRALYRSMMSRVGSRRVWSNRRFFAAKHQEQERRHQKFADTAHRVEPHIKDGPGGLRDIQTIGWVAKRHFGVERLHELVAKSFLTEEEYQLLKQGRELLWRIRYGLHLLSERREDRLLFDYQKDIASQFSYRGRGNRGVESFMKEYYRTVHILCRLNEMLLQHFQEEIILRRRKERIAPLNQRFQIRHDVIEAVDEKVFARYPFSLLEVFLLLQKHSRIKGVRASTIRLLCKHAQRIDDNFRRDIRARSYFLEIMRQPRYVGHELRRMHRYGVLGAYLPVFARIQGLMQFDLFHSYTVDEHILFVIRNLRLFGLPEHRKDFPLCWEVMQKIAKQEVLYIAALFHDIAKGRDGDHSELGARDANRFCADHDLSDYDSRMVSWLVRYHLLMSRTAQRQDIHDPLVITEFARKVADQNHLNHLYLLTVADIKATNPELWNHWRASLLDTLYHNTLRVLRRGLEKPLFKRKRVAENRAAALRLIPEAERRRERIDRFWKTLRMEYFLRHSSAELAWHAEVVLDVQRGELPVVRVDRSRHEGWTQIFVYTRDEPGVFVAAARGIEHLRLNVLDARIITSKTGYTLNTYVVIDRRAPPRAEPRRAADVIQCIREQLLHKDDPAPHGSLDIQDRKLRNFRIPTQVRFFHHDKRLSMEVITLDRPGILSRIGHILERCGVQIDGAKIATYGERVEDIFSISGPDKSVPDQGIDQNRVQNGIVGILD